ncbi:hypothetical protein [Rhodococcus aetherivorans]|uniref:hypothetical protein n=1 Tax=Rhodococcus aetherivorans TaxID=191292 RepID=UPI000A665CFE|nr:hypothetical protein [Rhodococcus aetherivorans]UGQ39396.1 hypothetical protein LRQ66_14360 [Rhodococcus aetherivorans]
MTDTTGDHPVTARANGPGVVLDLPDGLGVALDIVQAKALLDQLQAAIEEAERLED